MPTNPEREKLSEPAQRATTLSGILPYSSGAHGNRSEVSRGWDQWEEGTKTMRGHV